LPHVGTEPSLQPITNEHLIHPTANKEDGARLDVAADSFWGNDRQRTFFDIRVFNPLVPSYQNTPLAQCYRRNEQEKKRAYDQRVREIEHGSFSPLVFSATGGMGTVATVVYISVGGNDCRKACEVLQYNYAVDQVQTNDCVLPSCVSVDLDHPNTTPTTIMLSVNALLTLPAQWARFLHD
jgi:hypothetical protein